MAIVTVEAIAQDTDRVRRKCQQPTSMRMLLFVTVTTKPVCLLLKRKDQTKVCYISVTLMKSELFL